MDFSIMGDVLQKCCLTGSKAVIPDGVREIRSHAFLGCRNLRSIQLPDSLTTIGDEAFVGTRLGYITFPDSVTHVGERIFEDTQISELTIFGEDFEIDEIKDAYDDFGSITEAYGLDPEIQQIL